MTASERVSREWGAQQEGGPRKPITAWCPILWELWSLGDLMVSHVDISCA